MTLDLGTCTGHGHNGLFWDVVGKQHVEVSQLWLQTWRYPATITIWTRMGGWEGHATKPGSWTNQGEVRVPKPYQNTLLVLPYAVDIAEGAVVGFYAHTPDSEGRVGFVNCPGGLSNDLITLRNGKPTGSNAFERVFDDSSYHPAGAIVVTPFPRTQQEQTQRLIQNQMMPMKKILETLQAELLEQKKVVRKLQSQVKLLDSKPCFFSLSKTVSEPQAARHVDDALKEFIETFAKKYGAAELDTAQFTLQLRSAAVADHVDRPADPNVSDLHWRGARYWTAAHVLKVKVDGVDQFMGLFSMLNKVNRDDDSRLLLAGGIALQKCISMLVIMNRVPHFPPEWDLAMLNSTFRGAFILIEALSFWRELMNAPEDERIYRVPALQATSLERDVALSFLCPPATGMPPYLTPVLFHYYWQPHDSATGEPPCLQSRYIDERSSVRRVKEMTLGAYSAVKLVNLQEGIRPLTITLEVQRDNRAVSEAVPLARWH